MTTATDSTITTATATATPAAPAAPAASTTASVANAAPDKPNVGTEATPDSRRAAMVDAFRKRSEGAGGGDKPLTPAPDQANGGQDARGKGTEAPSSDNKTTQRDEHGRFKSSDDPVVAANLRDTEAPQQQPEKATPEQMKKYRAALKRSQWPDDKIAELPDDLVSEIGSKLLKRESDNDRKLTENQTLRRELDELRARLDQQQAPPSKGATPAAGDGTKAEGKPATAKPDAPAAATATPGPVSTAIESSLDEILATLSTEENGDFYGELVGPLKSAFGAVGKQVDQHVSRITEQFERKLAEYERTMGLDSDRLNMQFVAADPEFRRQFPQVRDPNTFREVVKRAYALANADANRETYFDSDGVPDWSTLMRHSATLVTQPNDPIRQVQAEMAGQTKRLVDSQGGFDTSGRRPTEPLTGRDALIEATRVHQSNMPRGEKSDRVRRLAAAV